MLVCALLSSVGGCGLTRWNSGREFATTSAGYAGRFRLAYGHWPAMNELEEFMCMRGRADRFGLEQKSCDAVVSPPYRTQLTSVADDLRMQFYDSAKRRMCSLRVLAPPTEVGKSIAPMIVIKTTLLECPGVKTDPCVPRFRYRTRAR